MSSRNMRECPFCGKVKDVRMSGYDFGRGFNDNVDAETEAIMFECKCGCRFDVNVVEIVDANEKIDFAFEKWNKRAKQ